jgi:hypothetical protein
VIVPQSLHWNLQSSLRNLQLPVRTLWPLVRNPASPHEPSASQEPPAKQPRICHSNVGVFVSSHRDPIGDSDKYRFINEHFVPELTYKFPRASNRRSFQHRWLSTRTWLRYSEQHDGGYCLPCALFLRPSVTFRSDPGVLVTRSLTSFQKALEILHKHDKKQFHRSSVVQIEEFLKGITNEQPSIRRRLSEATAQQIAMKLHSIVETVVLCGRQNIPLRGHQDSTMDVERTPCTQHGNFQAFLQFRVAAGDTVLRDHLAQSSRNTTYTSSRIQNQILDIVGSIVVGRISESQRCYLLHYNSRRSHWLLK